MVDWVLATSSCRYSQWALADVVISYPSGVVKPAEQSWHVLLAAWLLELRHQGSKPSRQHIHLTDCCTMVLPNLQALLLTGLMEQASSPAVSATIFVPSDIAITNWLTSLGCNSLATVAALNRSLLMDTVAEHFAPATVLPPQGTFNATMPVRQGIVTAADMATSNITLRTAAWTPDNTSRQHSVASASSRNRTEGAKQNATTASGAVPAIAAASNRQLALAPTNGSWDILAPSQAPLPTVTYNTSANATTNGPRYLALPPHTMAIVLTRTAQSQVSTTNNPSQLAAAVYAAAQASMLESLLYGPGNPVGTGARIVMNDLSTCR